MGREGERVFVHRFQQASDGIEQERRAAIAAIVEEVDAVFIHKAEMHVKPAARAVAIRLGHEGGGHAVFARDTAHEAFEEDGIIGGL